MKKCDTYICENKTDNWNKTCDMCNFKDSFSNIDEWGKEIHLETRIERLEEMFIALAKTDKKLLKLFLEVR